MKHPKFSQYNWPAKVLWCATLLVMLFVTGLSVFRAVSFGFSKLVVLAISAFVAIVICQYRPKFPNTRVSLSAKSFVAFWGIIWLGISGGVLLGAIASAASCFRVRDEKSRCLFEMCVDTIATFLAGFVFYLASGFLPNYNVEIVPNNLFFDESVIIAIALMTLSHYVITASLSYLFYRNENKHKIPQILKDTFVFPGLAYLLAIPATLISFFAFVQFGIEFGLVIAPLVVTGSLAYSIHKRRLAVKTRQITEASRIHLATVEALATAIDARDQVGIGHVRRTQIYAIGIGEMLDLSEGEINALRTGALLHDIGKLAVPDHILNKPGRLTPAEVEKTKIHSSVGASILEKVGFNYPVVPTVKYHHECWDGSGYPEALRGENIPLTARILAVADAYDTLRGARPYRPPVSRNEACGLVRSSAGTRFDPRIVSIFLKNLAHFEAEISAQGLEYRMESYTEDDADFVTQDYTNSSYVEQIKRANREVFTLYELARDFSSSLTLRETLSLFTSKIKDFVPFDTCAVYLMDDKTGIAASAHVAGENSILFEGKQIGIGRGVTGQSMLKRQALQNADPELDFDVIHPGLVSDYKLMVAQPLLADERLIGAVSLYSSEPSKYGEEHLRLLETIARIAADAISKSKRHAEAETNAMTDPMTGLPNARSLQIQFEKEVARAGRNGNTFHVLMLDLDGFKAVNDTFGHKTGDRMLAEIGKIIGGQLRDYDFLARYAGDEFVAIIPDTQSDEIYDLCQRIENAVNAFILPVGESSSRVGVSVGSASYPRCGDSFDQLIIAADKAMYAEKSVRKLAQNGSFISSEPPPIPKPAILSANSLQPFNLGSESLRIVDVSEEGFIVELDETNIVSTAIN